MKVKGGGVCRRVGISFYLIVICLAVCGVSMCVRWASYCSVKMVFVFGIGSRVEFSFYVVVGM